MLALPRGIDGGTAVARQAFDLGRIVQKNGTARDGFDHRPVIVIALQAKDDGASGRTIQKILHRVPEGGQVGVRHTAPWDFHAGDTLLADHFIEDEQHLYVDDAADEQFAQQPAPREKMDQVVE